VSFQGEVGSGEGSWGPPGGFGIGVGKKTPAYPLCVCVLKSVGGGEREESMCVQEFDAMPNI